MCQTSPEENRKGSDSTSLSIEEPVVEKPDVDSKKASMNEGITPLKRYGKAPIIEKRVQEMVTTKYPSLLVNLFVSASLEIMWNMTESNAVMAEDKRNGKNGSS